MRQRCGCGCGGRKPYFPWGYILIAAGIGLMLAYIIPYSLLITVFGIGLIASGICFMRRK